MLTDWFCSISYDLQHEAPIILTLTEVTSKPSQGSTSMAAQSECVLADETGAGRGSGTGSCTGAPAFSSSTTVRKVRLIRGPQPFRLGTEWLQCCCVAPRMTNTSP